MLLVDITNGGLNQMVQYVLDVPEELWESYKATVGSHRTLNEHIMDLIEEQVDDGSENVRQK